MRDKNGFNLTNKQRDRYLYAFKSLYCTHDKGIKEIVEPRSSIEVSELSTEKKKAPGREIISPQLVSEAEPKVSRGTSKLKARKEWREQVDIYTWTQTVQSLKKMVMMIGNEGKRNVVQAAVAKRMGLLPGSSDLFIARPVGIYHGLFLEVKQNRVYTISERKKDTWLRQEAFQARMIEAGFEAYFCFGCHQGIEIIKRYLAGW